MKTFEVYALNDPSYRGRTLVAAVMADRYEVNLTCAGNHMVTFYKNTFLSTKLISAVLMISAFAVLDTEFSVSIEREPTQTRWSSEDSRDLNVAVDTIAADLKRASGQFNLGVDSEPKKRRRKKSNPDSLLDLN